MSGNSTIIFYIFFVLIFSFVPVFAWVLSLGSLDSSHSPKNYKLGVKLIGHFKLPVGVNVSADGPFFTTNLYCSNV